MKDKVNVSELAQFFSDLDDAGFGDLPVNAGYHFQGEDMPIRVRARYAVSAAPHALLQPEAIVTGLDIVGADEDDRDEQFLQIPTIHAG
ncbi:MAG: hypothetical protein GY906_27805 [bacterium]|nr:hypothetical protein [bacterium]